MWIIRVWQCISPEVTRVLRSAVYPVQWLGLMIICWACFMYEINTEVFFLSRHFIFFLGGGGGCVFVLDLDKYSYTHTHTHTTAVCYILIRLVMPNTVNVYFLMNICAYTYHLMPNCCTFARSIFPIVILMHVMYTSCCRRAMEEFRLKHFPNRHPAFDGRKNLYTSQKLPEVRLL